MPLTIRVQNVGEGDSEFVDVNIKENRTFQTPGFTGKVTLPRFSPGDYMDIELPTGYLKPVIVPSNEYQKMCKDMNNISGTINVISKGFYIKFLCNAGSVYSREVAFGEIDDEEDEDASYGVPGRGPMMNSSMMLNGGRGT